MNGAATLQNSNVYLKTLYRLIILELNFTLFFPVENPFQKQTVKVYFGKY